jgi:hypothetical protein
MGSNHIDAMASVCIRADLLRRAESALKRWSVYLYEQIMFFYTRLTNFRAQSSGSAITARSPDMFLKTMTMLLCTASPDQ